MGLLQRAFGKFLLDPALNGVVALLLIVSFTATWRGLSDFISVQDGMASGLEFRLIVFLVVLALTLAMYVALRETMRWRNWKRVIPGFLAVALYGLLALWSVGFGYGFWWSLVAGEATSARELETAAAQIRDDAASLSRQDFLVVQSAFQDWFDRRQNWANDRNKYMIDGRFCVDIVIRYESLADAASLSARLKAAETVMSDAARLSMRKAEIEALSGGTCGVSSGGGEGPLFRARMETNQTIVSLSGSLRTEWSAPLQARLDTLSEELKTTSSLSDPMALQQAFGRFETTARDIAAEAEARGRAYAAQLTAKADQLDQPPVGSAVPYCHDSDLARALRLAANALAFTETVRPVSWRYSGGQEGVARSIETLWGSVFALRLPPLDGRSLIALIAAAAVDLALVVFAIFQSVAAAERTRAPARARRDADMDAMSRERDAASQARDDEIARAQLAVDQLKSAHDARDEARRRVRELEDQLRFDPEPETLKAIRAKAADLSRFVARLQAATAGGSDNREWVELQDRLEALIDDLVSLNEAE